MSGPSHQPIKLLAKTGHPAQHVVDKKGLYGVVNGFVMEPSRLHFLPPFLHLHSNQPNELARTKGMMKRFIPDNPNR